jgi:hypothetical protein
MIGSRPDASNDQTYVLTPSEAAQLDDIERELMLRRACTIVHLSLRGLPIPGDRPRQDRWSATREFDRVRESAQ